MRTTWLIIILVIIPGNIGRKRQGKPTICGTLVPGDPLDVTPQPPPPTPLPPPLPPAPPPPPPPPTSPMVGFSKPMEPSMTCPSAAPVACPSVTCQTPSPCPEKSCRTVWTTTPHTCPTPRPCPSHTCPIRRRPKPCPTTESGLHTSSKPPEKVCPPNSIKPTKEVPWDQSVPHVENPTADEQSNYFSCNIAVRECPMCSGVIISWHLVLTVCRNCLRNDKEYYEPKEITVETAYFCTCNERVEHQISSVEKIYRHPYCYSKTMRYQPNYDIGIIRSKTNFFGKQIAEGPVLPQPGHLASLDLSQNFYLSNSRRFSLSALTQSELLWLVLTKVVPGDICDKLLMEGTTDFCPLDLCAAYNHVGAGNFCYNDIGSSLVVSKGGTLTVIGLLTLKVGCGSARSVGAFVDVAKHLPWIQSVACAECDTIKPLPEGCQCKYWPQYWNKPGRRKRSVSSGNETLVGLDECEL